MTDPNNHLTDEQLQTLAGQDREDKGKHSLAEHLRDCTICATRLNQLSRLQHKPSVSAVLDADLTVDALLNNRQQNTSASHDVTLNCVSSSVSDNAPDDGVRVEHTAPFHGQAPRGNQPSAPETYVRPDETVLESIGPYKILQLLGQGGMGQVYLAEQLRPVKRRVALKVIRTETPTREILARFEAERQALAMMDHPNIAKVLDAGITESGRPYFAMELVKGSPITDYCDQARLDPSKRLELFVQACRAIQHAHQKGIIHRDIKPSNVLTTLCDGKPVVKVIDFGLAKALFDPVHLTEKTLYTQQGQVVGTLEYMSPEQAATSALNIDTRTDVYSLGVILYELLTGTTPIGRLRLRRETLDSILRIIREEEPPRPSARLSESRDTLGRVSDQRRTDGRRLSLMLKGDLDWIAVKALEKDRSRRYDGPAALADDVDRYLKGEAIEARPPSFQYQLQKVYRKNRAKFLLAAVSLLLLIGGLLGTGTMWLRATRLSTSNALLAEQAIYEKSQAERERDRADEQRAATQLEYQRAEDERDRAEATLARSNFSLAVARWDDDRISEAVHFLHLVPERYRDFEWYLANRRFEGSDFTCVTQPHPKTAIAAHPIDGSFATGGSNGSICLWDGQTGSLLHSFNPHTGRIRNIEYHGNGEYIVSASDRGEILVTRLADLRIHHQSPSWVTGFSDLDLSPNGRLVAIAGSDGLKIWDPWDAGELGSITQLPCTAVSFHPDSHHVALGVGAAVEIWDLNTASLVQKFDITDPQSTSAGDTITDDDLFGSPDRIQDLQFSSSGRYLLAAVDTGYAQVWDFTTGKSIGSFMGTKARISPHEAWLATVTSANVIEVRELVSGRLLHHFHGHWGPVTDLAFASDASHLLSCGEDTFAKSWNLVTGKNYLTQDTLGLRGYGQVKASADGTSIAFRERDSSLTVVDVASGQFHRRVADGVDVFLDLSSNGQQALFRPVTDSYKVMSCSIGSEELLEKLDSRRGNGSIVYDALFSPRHTMFASKASNENGGFMLWKNGQDGFRTPDSNRGRVVSLGFSPDEQRLVSAASDRTLKLWDTDSLTLLQDVPTNDTVSSIAFDGAGKHLACGFSDGVIQIRDAATLERQLVLRGHLYGVYSLGYNPSGTRLASISADNTLRLWDAVAGTELWKVDGEELGIASGQLNHRSSLRFVNDEALYIYENHETAAGFVRLEAPRSFPLRVASGHVHPIKEIRSGTVPNEYFTRDQEDAILAWDAATGSRRTEANTWPETDVQPDARYKMFSEGLDAIIVDCDINETWRRERQTLTSTPDSWHQEQASAAELAGDASRSLFHRAWLLLRNPDSSIEYDAFQTAFRVTNTSGDLSLLPVIEAASKLKRGSSFGGSELAQRLQEIRQSESTFPLLLQARFSRWLLDASKVERAVAESALQQTEDQASSRLCLNWIHIRSGQTLAPDQETIEADEDSTVNQMWRGIALLNRGDTQAAYAAAKSAADGLQSNGEKLAQDSDAKYSLLRFIAKLRTRIEERDPVLLTHDEAEKFNNAIWKTLTVERLPPSEDELKKMEQICKQFLDAYLINTLAVAYLRAGRWQESITAAEVSLQSSTQHHPIDLACIAISHFRLGDLEKAQEARKRMQAKLGERPYQGDQESRAFSAEVESLLGGL